MILFPPCKINLGLYVNGKRADGFHELQTIFFQLPWCDILEIVPAETFSMKVTGLKIEGDVHDNLCVKAYELLQKKHNIPSVQIHLHKIIPMGAGLGGGSADGTYVLLGLNQLFDLNLSDDSLRAYALELGSDCPLFVSRKVQYGTGRGEVLEDVALSLSGKFIHLVNLGIHVSTKEAFSEVPFNNNDDLRNLDSVPLKNWSEALHNVFEEPVFKKYPQLSELKYNLFKNGALYVSMTGTGSTMFAIYDKKPDLLYASQSDVIEKILQVE